MRQLRRDAILAHVITFRDPPPLPARVAPPERATSADANRLVQPWLYAVIGLVVLLVVASRAQAHQASNEAFGAAFGNNLPRMVERELLRELPIGTSANDLAARLGGVDGTTVTCRAEPATAASLTPTLDSTRVCLGKPVVRANSYTRMIVRFTTHDGRLSGVHACPALVHWSRAVLPSRIVRQLHAPAVATGCWRDEQNPADNEWIYATVPDRAFTVAAVHGADTVARSASPTVDTLIVHW